MRLVAFLIRSTRRQRVLVERGNGTGLTDAMLEVLSNRDVPRSMAEAGRRRVIELFSYDRIAAVGSPRTERGWAVVVSR